jgi:hypothetical protein
MCYDVGIWDLGGQGGVVVVTKAGGMKEWARPVRYCEACGAVVRYEVDRYRIRWLRTGQSASPPTVREEMSRIFYVQYRAVMYGMVSIRAQEEARKIRKVRFVLCVCATWIDLCFFSFPFSYEGMHEVPVCAW